MKIERSCTVPVGLRLLGQWNSMASKFFGPLIDIFGTPDDEADVVDQLDFPRFGAWRKRVKGEIVLP